MGFLSALGGLLGGPIGAIGAGLLGFGASYLSGRSANKRQINAIKAQEKELAAQQLSEQKAYRDALRSGGSGLGSGDFLRALRGRQFIGF